VSPAVGPLLDYLAAAAPQTTTTWQGWRVDRIAGGANNLVFHVTADRADLAIKFTIRDARDRAGREYGALLALQQADPALAPQPLLLERERYQQPVVVQTWLPGLPLDAPPASDAEWDALLDHLLRLHRLTPATVGAALPEVVLTMRSAAEGRARIQENVDRIPPDQRPATLHALLGRLDAASFAIWPEPRLSLCRGDCHCRNFLRCSPRWASVDWEYSGWGDPAFEVADLLAAPSFFAVSPERREWVIAEYAAHSADPLLATRLRTYYRLMLVWWAARLARSRYEIPRGLDRRLAARPATWQAEYDAKYEQYLERASGPRPSSSGRLW
jgi:aminoglycoside phosphotransferase (APT) family kinase protein